MKEHLQPFWNAPWQEVHLRGWIRAEKVVDDASASFVNGVHWWSEGMASHAGFPPQSGGERIRDVLWLVLWCSDVGTLELGERTPGV